MPKTRQLLPEGLADIPPGTALTAVLDSIDLSRLSALDCVEVMRARHRQTNHEQARLMAAMVEVALCGIGPDDELPRMTAPDEFAADEIRGALSWTRSAADGQLRLAWDLMHRLPPVFASLDRGVIDVPKARVFSDWTGGLTDHQALEICDRLLPEAPELTTGQLIDRVKRMAIALDPEWSRRRYEDAVLERKVVGYRNEDGTGNLCGYQLPVDRSAAACAHIDDVARKIKHAGDRRPINHIKADIYLGMLDGSYAGWTETDIIAHVRATADAEVAGRRDDSAEYERRGAAHRFSRGPGLGGDGGPARRAGVEIRAEVTTLLGLDDRPAEIAGWGHVHADLARQLVADQTAGEWRYALTDDDGRLLYEGITRYRRQGFPDRADAPAHGGIVELQISLSALRRLATQPVRLGSWANVVADLARQADRREQPDKQEPSDKNEQPDKHERGPAYPPPPGGRSDRGPRSAGRPLRRRTEIRDRTCTHPRCRAPAHGTDGDHIQEWSRGGATCDDNIGSACRHDHRLRHEGGWGVVQIEPGHLIWTSRLGIRYHVRAPLIIQPLPDPIPREPMYRHQAARHDAGQGDPDREDDAPTWQEFPRPQPAPPDSRPTPTPVPEPAPADESPPF